MRKPAWSVASRRWLLALVFCMQAGVAWAQSELLPADDRLKVDLMVVVAHPDDETMISPWLIAATRDEGRRVAIVYTTGGGSGGNIASSARASSLARVRDFEARQSAAALGIASVWFLPGRDTPSQNVLDSLGAWGHGQVLEELVRLIRLMRPDVVVSMLPVFMPGENHGDHQAAGILATEAFDLAADPLAFPAQVTPGGRVFEQTNESLAPWAAGRLYFFDEPDRAARFAGRSYAFDVDRMSPSLGKTYWTAARQVAALHRSQFPASVANADPAKRDPGVETMHLLLAKARIPSDPTGSPFDKASAAAAVPSAQASPWKQALGEGAVRLAGPWKFEEAFWSGRGLLPLPLPTEPALSVRQGRRFALPVELERSANGATDVSIEVPEGWTVARGVDRLPPGAPGWTPWFVDLDPPVLDKAGLADRGRATIRIVARRDGRVVGRTSVAVELVGAALPF